MLSHFLRASNKAVPSFVSYSVAYVTTGTTITVNAPSDNKSGDILVAILNDRDESTWTSPAGFTERVDNRICVATKVTSDSESSTYTFTTTSGNTRDKRVVIARFRLLNYSTISAVDTTSPYTVTGVTLSKSGFLLGAIIRNGNAVATLSLPASMTTIYSSGAINMPISFGYEEVPSGATGTRTFTSTDTSSVSAVLIGLES